MSSSIAQPGIIDWQYLAFLFSNISPYYWSYVGIGLCVGLSILGSAWCEALVKHNLWCCCIIW